VEASALPAPVALTRQRSTIGLAVLRLRSDEQLVALLRSGHDEAFQAIHDRYRQRLFAYMRQMLPLRQDAEDALQEVFERAYASLRAGSRELALRPWLYRIAHNRCVDHLRRPMPPPPEAMLQMGCPPRDPVTEADRRETLRRLLSDVRRLPEQQRSALLMRELGGISYADVAQALGVTVPAVKSLLVRARVSLAAAGEARDAACEEIRAELVMAHEGRVRPNPMARRHLRDCPGCREFRGHLRGVRRGLLALAPGLGPCGVLARMLGGGGTSSAAGGGAAAACGGAGASSVASTTGLLASAGAVVTGAGHVVTLLAATMVTAGGATAITHTLAPSAFRHAHPRATLAARPAASARSSITATGPTGSPAATMSSERAVTLTTSVSPSRASTVASAPAHRAAPVTIATVADNSLAPIPDVLPLQSSAPSSAPTSPAPAPGTGSPGANGTGQPSGAPAPGTPAPVGGATDPGSDTPAPVTPTPAGGSGPVQPPVGVTPAPGTQTPAGTGARTAPPATDSPKPAGGLA
jgi:RNA polymerase sigma factor (sigma-70 family)